MRVLFIKLNDTTDIINTLPAINAFKRDKPDAWLVYATFPGVNADIVESCQAIGDVLIVPNSLGEENGGEEGGKPEEKQTGMLSAIRKTAQKTLAGAKITADFIKRLQGLNLDAVIDLHVSMRTALIARNSKAAQIFAFRSENATDKKAALAFANTPYVNPSQPDYEKYNLLIANSLGTSASSQFDWSLPMHDPGIPTQQELQIIPTGLIEPKYWCSMIQALLQKRIPFRIVNCPLTREKTLSHITTDLFSMNIPVVDIERNIANALVQHGGPIVADGTAAYLSLALGLNTLAVGEKPTSPFIAPPDTFFYSYPGPKDLPYAEQFVELAEDLLSKIHVSSPIAAHEPALLEADESSNSTGEESKEAEDTSGKKPEDRQTAFVVQQAEAEAEAEKEPDENIEGLDEGNPHSGNKRKPLVFDNANEDKE